MLPCAVLEETTEMVNGMSGSVGLISPLPILSIQAWYVPIVSPTVTALTLNPTIKLYGPVHRKVKQ